MITGFSRWLLRRRTGRYTNYPWDPDDRPSAKNVAWGTNLQMGHETSLDVTWTSFRESSIWSLKEYLDKLFGDIDVTPPWDMNKQVAKLPSKESGFPHFLRKGSFPIDSPYSRGWNLPKPMAGDRIRIKVSSLRVYTLQASLNRFLYPVDARVGCL